MERTLKFERLYPTGQYANIKFVDEIINLPDEALSNVELAGKIRYLQMLESEIAYQKYVELMAVSQTLSKEEVAKFLEEQRLHTVKEISDKLYNK